MINNHKEALKLLFGSLRKTYEISSKIADNDLRRDSLKKIEGNYRV